MYSESLTNHNALIDEACLMACQVGVLEEERGKDGGREGGIGGGKERGREERRGEG